MKCEVVECEVMECEVVECEVVECELVECTCSSSVKGLGNCSMLLLTTIVAYCNTTMTITIGLFLIQNSSSN